jgi:hypothetical protein
MKALRHGARQQLDQFLSALFRPDELIELRFIESWGSDGKKQSRVARAASWLRRDQFLAQYHQITDFARRERANVYFGVCPRPRKGDSQDDQIRTVRCLWCDIDRVTAEEAFERWSRAGVPTPSIVVGSGSGIHGYWLLDRDVRLRKERSLITSMLPYFYRSFDGDHVQNLSRVMRLPGTTNYKDARNGKPTRPCILLVCQPEVRYPLDAFYRWLEQSRLEQRQQPMPSVPVRQRSGRSKTFLARSIEATDLVRQLDRPSRDRSRRDFAVVCDLLRLGLAREEIWPLVCDSSKFASNGRAYFDVTIANAERKLLLDSALGGDSRPHS